LRKQILVPSSYFWISFPSLYPRKKGPFELTNKDFFGYVYASSPKLLPHQKHETWCTFFLIAYVFLCFFWACSTFPNDSCKCATSIFWLMCKTISLEEKLGFTIGVCNSNPLSHKN
jgi:hypothetical protein